MQIISKGRLPTDVKYTMKCRKCETVTMFEYSEGRIVDDHRDGDAIVFECPTCQNEMWHGAGTRTPSSW